MTDLRRKLGKLALSRQSSRANSRSVSAQVSEDEGSFSDDESVGSSDTLDSQDSFDKGNWEEAFTSTVDGIVDRKKSSSAGREELLAQLLKIMRKKYCKYVMAGLEGELVESLLISLKSGKTSKERNCATLVLCVVVITNPILSSLFDASAALLKYTILHSINPALQSTCITTIAVCAYFCGVAGEVEAVLEFVLNIIDSKDNAVVLVAALEAYSLLVSSLDDPKECSANCMLSVIEHLEHNDISVRIAAGQCIAVLSEINDELPYHDIPDLIQQIASLSTESSKRMSKNDKRLQHSTFREILSSMSSNTAPFSVLKFKNSKLVIDSWVKTIRLDIYKKILLQGIEVQYLRNDAFRATLEFDVADSDAESDTDSVYSSKDVKLRQQESKKVQHRRMRNDRSRSGKGVMREWVPDDGSFE